MGKLKKFTRRAFLIGSTAIVGGIAFGYYKYVTPEDNPLLKNLKEGEAAITPFVKIDQNGITLITPRADSGQGAYSFQAHLLAEELDVDPLKVNLSPGQPSKAYYNGTLMEETVPGFGDIIGKLMGLQVTGGSSSVPDMYNRLRIAGAIARETLKKTVSQQYNIPIEQLTTENGQVILPDGTKISYMSLASKANEVELVVDVTLRPSSQWKYLGKPQMRVDTLAKSTGTMQYGIDFKMANLLYATVRTNPAVGAGMDSYDATKALTMKGVIKITPITNGVAVIADNTWRCIKAANSIDFKWKTPNYPKNSLQMWQVLEQHFADKYENLQRKNQGDVDTALAKGDFIEAEYRTPYLAHAPLEPMNATVLATDSRIDIWTGTQIPRFIEDHIVKITQYSRENIHVHVLPMGGSFGRRLEDTYVIQAVEIAQAMKGSPIKMTWSREEDMSHDYPRPMTMARGKGQVRDGHVSTFDLKLVSSSLAASWLGRVSIAPPGPDATITTGADDQPYNIENYRVTGYKAPEMVPISSWRSVGASENSFYHESFLDELIHQAGADPLNERIRLCNDDVTRKVLEELARISDWQGKKKSDNQGRGVAITKSFGVPCAQVVDVTNTPDGIRIDNVYIVADVGIILDPINLESQLFGGSLFGLGHAMNCELTYENYVTQQSNFDQYQAMRMHQAPSVKVSVLENGTEIRGAGEPAVPPAAPALANAIFAATGKRIRELPLNKSIKFI